MSSHENVECQEVADSGSSVLNVKNDPKAVIGHLFS
jgi:hypothetical protein